MKKFTNFHIVMLSLLVAVLAIACVITIAVFTGNAVAPSAAVSKPLAALGAASVGLVLYFIGVLHGLAYEEE